MFKRLQHKDKHIGRSYALNLTRNHENTEPIDQLGPGDAYFILKYLVCLIHIK